jgi:hypothetical protein
VQSVVYAAVAVSYKVSALLARPQERTPTHLPHEHRKRKEVHWSYCSPPWDGTLGGPLVGCQCIIQQNVVESGAEYNGREQLGQQSCSTLLFAEPNAVLQRRISRAKQEMETSATCCLQLLLVLL